MKIKISEVRSLLLAAAAKHVSDPEAEYFADQVIETHLRKSPRVNPISESIADLKAWSNKTKEPELISPRAAVFKINFHGLGPSLKLKLIHDQIEKRVKECGIAMLALDNSKGMHTLHLWVQGLAQRGIFAIASCNGGPLAVVPLNGTKGLLGTNPIAYAIPGEDTVVDMATSEIPFFEIVEAKKSNRQLKPNSAVDQSGMPTLDPQKAMDAEGISNLIPMGGNYKGFAINYLLEIMTGSLIGSKVSTEQDPNYVLEEHGGFILAFALDNFSTPSQFNNSVGGLNQAIRSQKPAPGKTMQIPGDTNITRKADLLRVGILDLDEKTATDLQGLAY